MFVMADDKTLLSS